MFFKVHRIFVLSIFLTIFMPAISQAKFMNKIDNNFHFEKYKTAESAKDALLKLHPIGGNAGELIKDLDIAIKNTNN